MSDYGFSGNPLKKDFPLTGKFEYIYSNFTKTIDSVVVVFPQNLRLFETSKSVWEEDEKEKDQLFALMGILIILGFVDWFTGFFGKNTPKSPEPIVQPKSPEPEPEPEPVFFTGAEVVEQNIDRIYRTESLLKTSKYFGLQHNHDRELMEKDIKYQGLIYHNRQHIIDHDENKTFNTLLSHVANSAHIKNMSEIHKSHEPFYKYMTPQQKIIHDSMKRNLQENGNLDQLDANIRSESESQLSKDKQLLEYQNNYNTKNICPPVDTPALRYLPKDRPKIPSITGPEPLEKREFRLWHTDFAQYFIKKCSPWLANSEIREFSKDLREAVDNLEVKKEKLEEKHRAVVEYIDKVPENLEAVEELRTMKAENLTMKEELMVLQSIRIKKNIINKANIDPDHYLTTPEMLNLLQEDENMNQKLTDTFGLIPVQNNGVRCQSNWWSGLNSKYSNKCEIFKENTIKPNVSEFNNTNNIKKPSEPVVNQQIRVTNPNLLKAAGVSEERANPLPRYIEKTRNDYVHIKRLLQIADLTDDERVRIEKFVENKKTIVLNLSKTPEILPSKEIRDLMRNDNDINPLAQETLVKKSENLLHKMTPEQKLSYHTFKNNVEFMKRQKTQGKELIQSLDNLFNENNSNNDNNNIQVSKNNFSSLSSLSGSINQNKNKNNFESLNKNIDGINELITIDCLEFYLNSLCNIDFSNISLDPYIVNYIFNESYAIILNHPNPLGFICGILMGLMRFILWYINRNSFEGQIMRAWRIDSLKSFIKQIKTKFISYWTKNKNLFLIFIYISFIVTNLFIIFICCFILANFDDKKYSNSNFLTPKKLFSKLIIVKNKKTNEFVISKAIEDHIKQ